MLDNFDPEQITFFAETDARGKHIPFGIKAKDRTRHMYIIGKTGMGKSTLLENMAVQDIKNGNGLAFIDPHGQTAETLLNYIPEERKKDVLYFAPFDTQYPVAFNVMEDVGPDRRHLVVSGLMSVFKKIFIDQWSARMEYILSNTLLALLEYPNSTLLGVNRMLSDKDYRKKVIDNITDPSVKSFWVDEFLKYNERYMQEAGDAIKNKIGQFTANPIIRNIIGQPKSSFDIRTIMDERKILIMNLSKGLIGETNANLLGSMLTTRIYLAAMSRADLTMSELNKTPNFYFYVDEFQSFANATFADILSEARKYKLNLTIAHQYIEQMEEEVRNAVFGNVGTIISFRVGPFDAEVLETIYTPRFLAPDIVNLGFAQVYLTLMIDGIGSAPFSATTLPPIPPASVSYRDMVVATSREQFGRPRAEVEETILEFHKPVEKERPSRPAGEGDKRPLTEAPEIKERPKVSRERTNGDAATSTRRPYDNGRTNDSRGPRTDKDTRVSKYAEGREDSVQSTPQAERRTAPRLSERPERNGSKPPVPTPSVADLRSVLQSITKQAEEKNGGEKNTGTKHVSATVPDPGLKDALAKVLHELPTPSKEPVEERVPEKVSSASSLVDSRQGSEEKVHDDPLAPKKLERMMRVHSSDKPPL
jgi:energy-coupling factor transporter ATP-binding protein EcfA2